ncbi:MAG: hypothetical protein FJY67_02860 [Calditrichaeota bacterium]|nr:hypothetical protein [Calditrichota bacterium]
MSRIRPAVDRTALLAASFSISISICICISHAAESEPLFPYAPGSASRWGATLDGSFDRRYLGNDLTYIRRVGFAAGRGVSPYMNLWAEFGLVSLQLLSGSEPRGDYGPSPGLGWTALLPVDYRGFRPYISGRATVNQSKLADDQYPSGRPSSSRRSRFDWNEGTIQFGVFRPAGSNLWAASFAFRLTQLDERRTSRTGVVVQRNRFAYDSGFRTGLAIMWRHVLPERFFMLVSAEGYTGPSGKLTLTVGQIN